MPEEIIRPRPLLVDRIRSMFVNIKILFRRLGSKRCIIMSMGVVTDGEVASRVAPSAMAALAVIVQSWLTLHLWQQNKSAGPTKAVSVPLSRDFLHNNLHTVLQAGEMSPEYVRIPWPFRQTKSTRLLAQVTHVFHGIDCRRAPLGRTILSTLFAVLPFIQLQLVSL